MLRLLCLSLMHTSPKNRTKLTPNDFKNAEDEVLYLVLDSNSLLCFIGDEDSYPG